MTVVELLLDQLALIVRFWKQVQQTPDIVFGIKVDVRVSGKPPPVGVIENSLFELLFILCPVQRQQLLNLIVMQRFFNQGHEFGFLKQLSHKDKPDQVFVSVFIKVSFGAEQFRDTLPKVHLELVNGLYLNLVYRVNVYEEVLYNICVLNAFDLPVSRGLLFVLVVYRINEIQYWIVSNQLLGPQL